jgi:hypothetical protein
VTTTILREMSDTEPTSGSTEQYRFSRPDGDEIETREFNGDDAAEAFASELSKSKSIPVVIHRLYGSVDWRYLTEADERP